MDSHKKEQARYRKRKYRALKEDCNKDLNEVMQLLETNNSSVDEVSQDTMLIPVEKLKDNAFEICPCMETDIEECTTQAIISFEEAVLTADLRDELKDTNILLQTKKLNVIDRIRSWAIEKNVTCSTLDALLEILREDLLPDLPKTAKTFLGTALADYKITDMEDSSPEGIMGEFIYMSLLTGLTSCITDFHEGDIELIINIDGLPLSHSKGKCFWPILSKVHYVPDVYKPFVVAIYCGQSKPKKLSEYLKKFITELNHLQQHGIYLHKKTFNVNLKCFVADTPARSYLKCVKGHGGYGTCERCIIHGIPYKVGKKTKVIYPGINHQARNNESFRNKDDSEHHTGTSPLEDIKPEVDMTTCFLLDFMHLGCCGIMKKLLEMWMYGTRKIKLSPYQKLEISRRLLCLRSQQTSDFQRKIRSIFCIRQWKATELRFFLLYCGPIVLRNLICPKLYRHFLLLHIAFRILCSDRDAISCNAKAKEYLEKFVLLMPMLYGTGVQVINIHNLTHVADDVLNMNCSLSRINCFPFESMLGQIKKILRTAVKPLAQVCRRTYERTTQQQKEVLLPSDLKIHKYEIKNGTLFIKKITINFSLSVTTKAPNNRVLLKNGYVMEIESIFGNNATISEIFIRGKIWRKKKNIYSFPEKSSNVDTWNIKSTFSKVMTFPIISVERKLMMMKLIMKPRNKEQCFITSLLHT